MLWVQALCRNTHSEVLPSCTHIATLINHIDPCSDFHDTSQWIVLVLIDDLHDLVEVIIVTVFVTLAHLVRDHVPNERVGIERRKLMNVVHGLDEVVSGLPHFVLYRA